MCCRAILTVFWIIGCCHSKPFYPLYGIDSGHKEFPNPTAQDLSIIATNFTHIQGVYSTKQLMTFKQANAEFKPVWYINSDTEKSPIVEGGGYRMDTSYYLFGNLVQDITPGDQHVGISIASKKLSPLVASDESGPVSSRTNSVVWIRLKNELMKVLHVNPPNGNSVQWIKVSRGFSGGGSATHHNKNDNVFVPIYNGDNHGFPANKRRTKWLDYCVDPASGLALQMIENHTTAGVADGYAGSWIDCFSDGQYNSVDIGGVRLPSPRSAWDFNNNQPYNHSTFFSTQMMRLEQIFKKLHNKYSRYPTILANNIASGYYRAREWRMLQANPPSFPKPLDGYCLEAFAGREKNHDKYQSGCSGTVLIWQDETIWLRNIMEVADAAQKDVAIFPMVAQAGCKSTTLERVNITYRDRFETYAYASFLLAIEKPDGKPHLGLPPFYQNHDHTIRYAHVNERYFWKIGTPTRTVAPNDITKYKPKNHQSFVRPFTNGVVAVNPTTKPDHGVPLGGEYLNPLKPNAPAESSVSLEPQTAVILLKSLEA